MVCAAAMVPPATLFTVIFISLELAVHEPLSVEVATLLYQVSAVKDPGE